MNSLTTTSRETLANLKQRRSGGRYSSSSPVVLPAAIPSSITSKTLTPTITRSTKRGLEPRATLARALGTGLDHSQNQKPNGVTGETAKPSKTRDGDGAGGTVTTCSQGDRQNSTPGHEPGAKATNRVTLALPWIHPLRIGFQHGATSPRPARDASLRVTPPSFSTSPPPNRCEFI